MNGSTHFQDVQAPSLPETSAPAGKRRHTARWVLLIIAAFAGLLFFRYRKSQEATAAKAAQAANAPRIVPITASIVKQQDVPVILEGLGTVTPLRTVTVHTLVNGTLENVFFKEGQDVKQGDLLALVDPRPFEVQLHQAQAALAKDEASYRDASITLQRDVELLRKKLVPPQTVDDQQALADEAKASMMADKASIESAQLNITYAHITAPADATTGIRQVDPGNLIQTTDANGIVVLTQMDPMSVIFTLPQDDLPRIIAEMAKGPLKVEIFTRDSAKSLGTGTVSLVNNQINTSTAMVELRAILPNPKRILWPQQFVKARLRLQTMKDVIAVHSNVVQQGPEGTYAYIVKPDNTVTMQPVTVSSTAGELSVISKGLSPGDEVVEDGQFQLKPGAKISVNKAGTEAAPSKAPSESP